jgi:hypothetical protein
VTRTLAILAGVLLACTHAVRPEARALDPVTTPNAMTVQEAKGGKQRVPAVDHRFVARAEAQVALGGNTRVLRTSEEAREIVAAPAAQNPTPAKVSVSSGEALMERTVLACVGAGIKVL